jgi:hypothetical protein
MRRTYSNTDPHGSQWSLNFKELSFSRNIRFGFFYFLFVKRFLEVYSVYNYFLSQHSSFNFILSYLLLARLGVFGEFCCCCLFLFYYLFILCVGGYTFVFSFIVFVYPYFELRCGSVSLDLVGRIQVIPKIQDERNTIIFKVKRQGKRKLCSQNSDLHIMLKWMTPLVFF